ncbi:MAG: bifunctional phosphopantothenoylcysteine decarboxylase/phosphopantothenate--cysteine ligase CoaBC [Myxococcales bacterium]|nr:bifunctional phosphopantothenoylcysteine decarboxylase/phosphopantothenate--cysteine ligase CoaBC [Myxococcales bacterium]
MSALAGKTLLVVVGGGIAAFKSALVVRELQRRGARVEVVLTEAATRFVTPVTFAAITGRKAHVDLWDASFPGELHVQLTDAADGVLVVPATADFLAKMAHGLGDDLGSVCLLAARGPVLVAPAMHPRMWSNPATVQNVATLRARGVAVCGPVDGPLASGASGMGRMVEPEPLVDALEACFTPQDLAGLRVLITAGGTHEALDPVRFLGNRSSGKMGYALAERAQRRGAAVTLVSGPVSLAPPADVTVVRVRSAVEMFDSVSNHYPAADVVVMAAAVADYRPAEVSPQKLKKTGEGVPAVTLVRNPDILASLGARRGAARHPTLVGFAVETENLVANARDKLARKGCDLIVANRAEDGFEGDSNVAVLVSPEGDLPVGALSKRALADRIFDHVVGLARPGV